MMEPKVFVNCLRVESPVIDCIYQELCDVYQLKFHYPVVS